MTGPSKESHLPWKITSEARKVDILDPFFLLSKITGNLQVIFYFGPFVVPPGSHFHFHLPKYVNAALVSYSLIMAQDFTRLQLFLKVPKYVRWPKPINSSQHFVGCFFSFCLGFDSISAYSKRLELKSSL